MSEKNQNGALLLVITNMLILNFFTEICKKPSVCYRKHSFIVRKIVSCHLWLKFLDYFKLSPQISGNTINKVLILSFLLAGMFSHLNETQRGTYTPIPGMRGRNILEIVEQVNAAHSSAASSSTMSSAGQGSQPEEVSAQRQFTYNQQATFHEQSTAFYGKTSGKFA